MKTRIKKSAWYLFVGLVVLTVCCSINGCSTLTAVADLNQHPPVNIFTSKEKPSKVFDSVMKTMASFGKIIARDEKSGVVQGKKGNWRVNVIITPDRGSGSLIKMSARYIPSKTRMDFNTRQMITEEFMKKFEEVLGSPLSLQKVEK